MKRYLFYQSTTGSIDKVVETSSSIDEKLESSQDAIVDETGNANDETHYVDLSGPSIAERQPIDPSVSTQTGEATLSGLPDPTTVSWQGQFAEATGGTAAVQFSEPGVYTLLLEASVAYQPTEIEVTIP
mgnify:CR=1 FL=1